MKTAYVVTGERGNYSDWRLWLVAAFPTKERADAYRDFIDGFRRELSAQVKATFPAFGEMSMEEEGRCFDHIEARAKEIGLTARSAFGVYEPCVIDVITSPESYGNETTYKVTELPWDTKIAGGIPK